MIILRENARKLVSFILKIAFFDQNHLEIKSNKGIHYADRSILMYSSGYLGKLTWKRNKLPV